MHNISAPAPERIAIYARYSSDLQNPSSIDDQIALCRSLIERQFQVSAAHIMVYSDAAITGATMRRPGLKAFLRAAERKEFDLLITEGLDRLSRSLKDIATIHAILEHMCVVIYTAHEGEISTLHVGMKGTMNELYLKDLKDKIRRAHIARAKEGRHPAGLAYGYRVVRGVVDENNNYVNGLRKINEKQAAVIRRIFGEFVSGKTVKAIARDLNSEGIPSPRGGLWQPTTIKGVASRGDGILRKETYRGVMVYNRQRPITDPKTGRKRRILKPESEWIYTDVPELRIIDEKTWHKAQKLLVRQAALPDRGRPKSKAPRPTSEKSKPSAQLVQKQPLTGLVRCGSCRGNANLANKQRYVCATARFAKTCANYRAVRTSKIIKMLFPMLHDALEEVGALRPEIVNQIESDDRKYKELAGSIRGHERSIDRLLIAIEEGIEPTKATIRIRALEQEVKAAKRKIQIIPPPPPSEDQIKLTLARHLNKMEQEFFDKSHVPIWRAMLALLVECITLTPINDHRQGSTIDIELRKDGWPALWRLVDENRPKVQ